MKDAHHFVCLRLFPTEFRPNFQGRSHIAIFIEGTQLPEKQNVTLCRDDFIPCLYETLKAGWLAKVNHGVTAINSNVSHKT